MDRIKSALLLTALTLTSALSAQERNDSTYRLNRTVEEAELLVPRIAKHPVKSMVISSGDADAIDTLDTVNEKIKVILYSDNSWKYWKDPSFILNQEDFTRNMDDFAPDAYGIAYADLPREWSIWLVDSVSQYRCPLTGTIGPRGKFGIRRGRRHQGVDLPLTVGTPIYAAFDGKVRISRTARGYGNLVVIRHINGLETFYGHLSRRDVKVGDWVTAGDVIGLGGNTGRSTGPHLHFETRHMGYAFDPQWIIDFKTGDLRKQLFVLKKKYFSPGCNYEQDFEDEIKNEEEDIQEEKERNAIKYHRIVRGDTLSGLAVKYHTTVRKLCQLNGIKETTLLQLGRQLRVQ